MDWLIVAGTLLASAFLFQFRGRLPHVGSQMKVSVTVVPQDRRELGCSSARVFEGGLTCGYETGDDGNSGRRTRSLELGQTLTPYVSTEHAEILLSSVFAHRGVEQEANRRARLPATEQRFTVRCTITLLAKLETIDLRFTRKDQFHASGPLWAARADSCAPVP